MLPLGAGRHHNEGTDCRMELHEYCPPTDNRAFIDAAPESLQKRAHPPREMAPSVCGQSLRLSILVARDHHKVSAARCPFSGSPLSMVHILFPFEYLIFFSCILGVWCLVILCISIGIILSVVSQSRIVFDNSESFQVFGSAPATSKGNGTIVPIQAAVQRSGGSVGFAQSFYKQNQIVFRFMEDAMEMEEASSRNEISAPQWVRGGGRAPPGLQSIIGKLPRLKRRRRKK